MVIGDAVALDSWVGFVEGTRTVDDLADLRIWGKGEEEAAAHFEAPPIPTRSTRTVHGWLDLPLEEARRRAATINQWAVEDRAVLRWTLPPSDVAVTMPPQT